LSASISQSNASCYHACNEALAIGSTDGTVKLWDLNTIRDHRVLNADLDPMINMAPTKTVSHRAPLGMMPFIRTRLKERIINVHVDNSKGSHFHLATATEKGEAFVWDVHKAEPILSLSSNKIHKSALSRASKEKTPHVTSLMLFRTTLVCGTSCGFIRVFDLRSGKLTHRLAGHPGMYCILHLLNVL
jgi:WD40 repeat protein